MLRKMKKSLCYISSMMLVFTAVVAHSATIAKADATTPQSGNIYYIKNKNSGLYLQVANDSSTAGANVCQSKGTGSTGQRWILEKNSSTGNYRLHPATDMTGGISLDVANGSSANGTNIQIYSNNGHAAQNFSITPADNNGGYYISTEVSGFNSCLDVSHASKSSGANVIEYTKKGSANQIWYFEQAPWPGSSNNNNNNDSDTGNDNNSNTGSNNTSTADIANNYPVQKITFVSTNDGKYVTGQGANSTVTSNGTASDSNNWVIQKVGSDYYRIVNSATGYVLAPSGNNAYNGASVVTTGSTNSNAQYWKIVSVKTDRWSHNLNYKLVNYSNTSLALTLSGSSYTLSSYNGSSTQCFRFNSYGAEGFAGYCKDMNGSEKASVSGGVLGHVVYVNSLSELQKYASGSTPYTIVISSNISASSLTKVNVGKNKTFIGSYSNHTLTNIHFRNISSSGNNIYKNITFSHNVEINNNDDIQMYISNGTNFWLDHCTWTGHNMNTDSSIHNNDTDKFLYVGLNSTFVTVNGCYFGGHKYGLILGYPEEDGAGTYDGYPCMTIANNYFHTTQTRAPGLMRYGYFHCYNNFVYNFKLGYTPYTNCKIYSEKNYFDNGSYNCNVVNGSGNNSQFLDVNSYSTTSYPTSIGSLSWRPYSNYGYATRNAQDARTWAISNCGSKNSALNYAID